MQTRLCDKEYEGMPCRIFSSVENDFTLIYTPKPLSRESAEAIIRNEPDLMRHEICFHTTPDEAAAKFRHVGMWNVHRRLQYSFGEGYGLAIQSQPGQGTTVTVRLPGAPTGKEPL